MKKIISTILTVLCMTAMVCCSNESVIMGNESTTTTTIATTINASTLALGKMIANAKLQESVMNGNTSWTEQTEISDYYPIYTTGIDGVSHIEFKLSTNGEDAGYILASVTDNDILVPECSDNAKSTTEIYRDALNRTDFNVYRYNWFESAAESVDNGRGGVTVLASIGLDGSDITIHNGGRGEDSEFDNEYAQKKAEYAAKLQANKCLPYYDKTDLDKYYEQQTAAGRGEVESTVTDTYRLKNKFRSGFHTPSWNQKEKDGQKMGCTIVAWGEVFAYWKEFKNKPNLFRKKSLINDLSVNQEDTTIFNELWKIRSYCKTNKSGGTFTGDTFYGMQYANYDPWGAYSNKQFIWTNGYTDVKKVINEIDSDRPVMLCINSSGVGVLDHTVVIEEAEKTYYRSTGFVTQYAYKINQGWGRPERKWIYHYGTNFTSIYDAFLVNLN